MKPKESLAYLQSLQPRMLEELIHWVNMESPTTDKASVDAFGAEIAAKLSDIGMVIEVVAQEAHGNHLIARWGIPENTILLIGHLDTVWDLETLARMPVTIDGDVARGPGIFDMKGGILIALYALRLLCEQNFHHHNITLLLNSDEETGSFTSREIIEQEAAHAACALILEPAGPNRSLKTRRRGVGRYEIIASGRAAHAGVEPEKGINAIEEIAHQILEIQSWNLLGKGISVNADVVHGGTRTNVIAERAVLDVDVRCDTPEDMEWIEQKFAGLCPKHPGVKLQVTGGIERPPLVRSRKVLGLYEEAKAIGLEFGYQVSEYETGGGSDGNFTAAMGVATLDGLGPEGAGAHASHEHILISSLPLRTNLLYHLLRNRITTKAQS